MSKLLQVGTCEVDLAAREVRMAGEARAIEPRAFALLACLAQRCDRVVTKRELLDTVWPGRCVSDAALARAVMKARQAIGDTGEPALIRTLPRVGYRLVLSASQAPGAAPAAAPAAPAAPLRIALLPFVNATGDAALEWVELGLMSLVTHAIAHDARLSPVAMQSLLTAMDGARTAGVDVVEAVQRATGAQVVVRGSVSRIDGGYELAFEGVAGAPPSQVRAPSPGALVTGMARSIEEMLFPGTAAADAPGLDSNDPLAIAAFARGLQALMREKYPQAANLLRMTLGSAPGSPAVELELLRALAAQGDLEGCKPLARRLQARAERTGDLPLAARVHISLCRVHLHRSSFKSAAFHVELGLRLMGEQGPPDEMAFAQLLRADVASYVHDFATLEHALDRVRVLCETSGNRLLPLRRLGLLAVLARAGGDYERAAELCIRAAREARELHAQRTIVLNHAHAAADLALLGRWAEAAANAEEAFAAAMLVDDPRLVCMVACNASWIYRLSGTPAASQRIVDALPPADRLSPLARQWTLYARGHHAATTGDHAQAAQLFGQMLQLLREAENRINEQDVLRALLCSLVHCGELDEAEAELTAVLRRPPGSDDVEQLRWLLHSRALLAHARGHAQQALDRLLELAETSTTPLWRAWALLDAAWLHAEAGRCAEALGLLQRLPPAFSAQPLARAVAARAHFAAGDRAAAMRLHQRYLEASRHRTAQPFLSGLGAWYAGAKGAPPPTPCLPSQL